jgi:hypothetical protein
LPLWLSHFYLFQSAWRHSLEFPRSRSVSWLRLKRQWFVNVHRFWPMQFFISLLSSFRDFNVFVFSCSWHFSMVYLALFEIPFSWLCDLREVYFCFTLFHFGIHDIYVRDCCSIVFLHNSNRNSIFSCQMIVPARTYLLSSLI